MKRNIPVLLAAVLALLLGSCSGGSGEVRGVVSSLTDSVLVADVDGSQRTFSVLDARLTNGAVMAGDSVVIGYDGQSAVTIQLIPQPGRVINLDDLKEEELLTRPATEEQVKDIEKFVDKASKARH